MYADFDDGRHEDGVHFKFILMHIQKKKEDGGVGKIFCDLGDLVLGLITRLLFHSMNFILINISALSTISLAWGLRCP